MSIGHIPFAKGATPVFIAGAPRSGTTLLTALLNSHPQVLITNELRPFMLFNDVYRRTKIPSELLPEHPLREKFRQSLLQAMKSMFHEFYKEEVTKDELGCPAEAGASVKREIKAFGDKNPGYADPHAHDCLNFIAETVPDAKFIHIHRDPRACVASYLDIPVYSNELDRCINIWSRHTKSMIELRESLGAHRVLEVRYEDLVTEKGDAIFRRIENHINVDAAHEPLDFLARERARPIPYRSPTTPVEKLGRAAWEGRLSADTATTIMRETASLSKMLAHH